MKLFFSICNKEIIISSSFPGNPMNRTQMSHQQAMWTIYVKMLAFYFFAGQDWIWKCEYVQIMKCKLMKTENEKNGFHRADLYLNKILW